MVKKALGDLVDQIIYCTDSTIALSWCRNLKIKLRLFVYNRVMTILQMCEWTTGETEIPLYHIDGKLNLADLLTKHHELVVDSVTLNSLWQDGLPWMKLDVENMPLVVYEQLIADKSLEAEIMAECYDKVMTGEFSQFEENNVLMVHDLLRVNDSNEAEVMVECNLMEVSDFPLSNASLARVQVNLLVDPVLHGWPRALRIINYLLAVPENPG